MSLLFPIEMSTAPRGEMSGFDMQRFYDSWNRRRCLVALLIDVVAPSLYPSPLERRLLFAWTQHKVTRVGETEPWVPSLDGAASEWAANSPRQLAVDAVRAACTGNLVPHYVWTVIDSLSGDTRELQLTCLWPNAYWRIADMGYDPTTASKEELEAIAGAMIGLATEHDGPQRWCNVVQTILDRPESG